MRCLGFGLDDARAALEGLDRSALAAIGIDVEGVERPPVPLSRKRTPFTSGARSVLPHALVEVKKTDLCGAWGRSTCCWRSSPASARTRPPS